MLYARIRARGDPSSSELLDAIHRARRDPRIFLPIPYEYLQLLNRFIELRPRIHVEHPSNEDDIDEKGLQKLDSAGLTLHRRFVEETK